jgi:hypothetical protein
MSWRNISKRLCVNRDTIKRVAEGSHPYCYLPGIQAEEVEVYVEAVGGIRNRCSGCGAMVYGACYECRLKKEKRNGELARVHVGPGESLDLDLSDEEVERLKELREAMRARGELGDET